jgi:hypothetical protein
MGVLLRIRQEWGTRREDTLVGGEKSTSAD